MNHEDFHDFVAAAGQAGALVGLLFIAASVLSLVRLRARHGSTPRDAFFLAGQPVTLLIQLIAGISAIHNPDDVGTSGRLPSSSSPVSSSAWPGPGS